MQQQNNPREPPQRPFSNLGQGIKGSERHGMMASLHNHSVRRTQFDRFQAHITHALSYYHSLETESNFSRSHGTSLAYISNTDVSKEAPRLHRQVHNKEQVHHTDLVLKWSRQIQYNEMK